MSEAVIDAVVEHEVFNDHVELRRPGDAERFLQISESLAKLQVVKFALVDNNQSRIKIFPGLDFDNPLIADGPPFESEASFPFGSFKVHTLNVAVQMGRVTRFSFSTHSKDAVHSVSTHRSGFAFSSYAHADHTKKPIFLTPQQLVEDCSTGGELSDLSEYRGKFVSIADAAHSYIVKKALK